jgi:hypothetical protein
MEDHLLHRNLGAEWFPGGIPTGSEPSADRSAQHAPTDWAQRGEGPKGPSSLYGEAVGSGSVT